MTNVNTHETDYLVYINNYGFRKNIWLNLDIFFKLTTYCGVWHIQLKTCISMGKCTIFLLMSAICFCTYIKQNIIHFSKTKEINHLAKSSIFIYLDTRISRLVFKHYMLYIRFKLFLMTWSMNNKKNPFFMMILKANEHRSSNFRQPVKFQLLKHDINRTN